VHSNKNNLTKHGRDGNLTTDGRIKYKCNEALRTHLVLEAVFENPSTIDKNVGKTSQCLAQAWVQKNTITA
jgi:hypothetical protein